MQFLKTTSPSTFAAVVVALVAISAAALEPTSVWQYKFQMVVGLLLFAAFAWFAEHTAAYLKQAVGLLEQIHDVAAVLYHDGNQELKTADVCEQLKKVFLEHGAMQGRKSYMKMKLLNHKIRSIYGDFAHNGCIAAETFWSVKQCWSMLCIYVKMQFLLEFFQAKYNAWPSTELMPQHAAIGNALEIMVLAEMESDFWVPFERMTLEEHQSASVCEQILKAKVTELFAEFDDLLENSPRAMILSYLGNTLRGMLSLPGEANAVYYGNGYEAEG